MDTNKQAERLRIALKENHMKQKDLAEFFSFSQQYISDICMNRKPIPFETGYAFAKLLNVRFEWLLGLDDIKNIEDKTIKDFTTDELLAEIKRRIKE